MFSETSRYYRQKVVDAATKEGRTVKAVTLRRLPSMTGESTVVKGNDRLDIMAQRRYRNPAMFWHIADANTELQANDLLKETGRIIRVPEQ
ncbi:MAG TPA: hypothetical protein ENG73_10010 [Desulfobacterales bacterium]|nr:MAG: hypothetical protein DRH50_00525 [Deltaproteobacteria bacterium]HDG98484.1 hypothetical protein [Desulfobacterales bacterium]HDZ24586.1 hypothetical protein [Desulfobacteraceae bacterium]